MKRTGVPAARNIGQHARAASLRVRDPWLPPVISTVKSAEGAFAGREKNSSRTGNPVNSTLSFGKYLRVSSKLIKARLTQGAIQRFAAPGTAFGSITTTG